MTVVMVCPRTRAMKSRMNRFRGLKRIVRVSLFGARDFRFTGAADTVLVLARDAQGTTLYGRGRDIEEVETAMTFDRTTGLWTVLGAASDVRRSDQRQIILVT